jgi:FHS family L-fucose permease-like MFS transporter
MIDSTPILHKMASLAASIKGQAVGGMDPKAQLGVLLTFYWGGAMIGRFIGAALMQRIRPGILLSVFAVIAAFLVVTSMMASGLTALLALLAVGLFNSIMFPTIFTLGIENLGDSKPQGSGVLCTAIVGGAFIPPAFGALVDVSGFSLALVLPVLCYFYIAGFGYVFGSKGSRMAA